MVTLDKPRVASETRTNGDMIPISQDVLVGRVVGTHVRRAGFLGTRNTWWEPSGRRSCSSGR